RRRELDRVTPRREQRGAVGHSALASPDRRGKEVRRRAMPGEIVAGEPRRDLLPYLGRQGVFREPDEPVEHSAQRPVRESLAVWQALRDGHLRVLVRTRQPVEEFLAQPRLSRPRGRDDADQERSLLGEGAARDELEL